MNMVPSFAQQDIKSGQLKRASLWQRRSTVHIHCAWCGVEKEVCRRGKSTAKFCSRKCANRAHHACPEILKKMRQNHYRAFPIEHVCLQCQRTFFSKTKVQKFCSRLCANRGYVITPSQRKSMVDGLRKVSHLRRGVPNPVASKWMKEHNPMKNAISVEKMRAKLIGRKFVHRGGNGKLTTSQILLSKMSGLVVEYAIRTITVRDRFLRLPTCYKVDLAHVATRTAIEVDGMKHKLPKQIKLDEKKTSVLSCLGWSVLRFWNWDVLENTEVVIDQIQSCITSKLKTITTT